MSNTSEIIDFYNGERNKNGVTIDEVWNYEDSQLEHVHNYIQWLFPIVEPDYWNRDTPKLTQEDIDTFKNSVDLKVKLLISLEVMLEFWGLEMQYNYDSVSIFKSKRYELKSANWQTAKNHNFLRITRVIHSLNDIGLRKVSEEFLNCLMGLVKESPEKFNSMSVNYWKDAMVKDMKERLY